MSRSFDLLVCGGGPAGAVVAYCLARSQWRVAIIESTDFKNERFGETLPPEINPLLKHLGLWEPFQAMNPTEAPGIVSVWGSDIPGEQDFIRSPHGCGWHVDRNRFDAMLCQQAISAGAALIRRKAKFENREDGCWRLDEIRAPLLVDATGRKGLCLNGPTRHEIEDRLLANVLRVVHAKDPPGDLRTYIESTPNGWWYTAPIPRQETVAMFFTGTEQIRTVRWSEELLQAPLTASRFVSAKTISSRTLYAGSGIRTPLHGPGWLAVGDSASTYDPLSGMGIFKALRQGLAASEALEKLRHGDLESIHRYAQQIRAEFNSYVRQRRLYYAQERRWPDSSFWAARQDLPAK